MSTLPVTTAPAGLQAWWRAPFAWLAPADEAASAVFAGNTLPASEEERTAGAANASHPVVVRLAVVWLLMLPLVAFWATQLAPARDAALSVMPAVPKAGEPVVATLQLKNTAPAEAARRYELVADGKVIAAGVSRLPASAQNTVQFARRQPLEVGDQALFTARVSGDGAEQAGFEDVQSATGAAPGAGQGASIMSVSMASSITFMASSVSFAAASSTVMNSMVSMSYYRSSFMERSWLDAGLIMVLAMLGLGIFVEATGFVPVRGNATLERVLTISHRLRLPLIALYIIFGGLVVTRLALLFGNLS